MQLGEYVTSLGATHLLATDGSVAQGQGTTGEAGGGYVLYDVATWTIISRGTWPLGIGKCSYDSENGALKRPLIKIASGASPSNERPNIVVMLDGQSTIMKMSGRVPRTLDAAELCRAVDYAAERYLVHCRGHADITTNEEADAKAMRGRQQQERIPVVGTIPISHGGVDAAGRWWLESERWKALKAASVGNDSAKWYLDLCTQWSRTEDGRLVEELRKPDESRGDNPRYYEGVINQMLVGKRHVFSEGQAIGRFFEGNVCPFCGVVGGKTYSLVEHCLTACPRFNDVSEPRRSAKALFSKENHNVLCEFVKRSRELQRAQNQPPR